MRHRCPQEEYDPGSMAYFCRFSEGGRRGILHFAYKAASQGLQISLCCADVQQAY